MGLDFSKTNTQQAVTYPDTKNEVMVVEQYDIVEDRKHLDEVLVNSKEVDALVSTIEIDNLETIVTFGAQAAEEISKASDVVLNSMNMSQLDDSSEMLNTLAKIMSKFDIDEIAENPTLFGKLFGNLRKQLDKILAKYHTMGDEVDKIYVQLRQRNIQSNVPQLLLVLGRYRSRFLLRVLKQQREIPLTCGFVGHRYTFQKAAGLHLPMQAKANGLLDFGQFKKTPIQENVWVLLICQICCIRIC